jgi:hypothetical protein
MRARMQRQRCEVRRCEPRRGWANSVAGFSLLFAIAILVNLL